ncbi:unnamed protein product, partial [Closterium sp. NIES-53]
PARRFLRAIAATAATAAAAANATAATAATTAAPLSCSCDQQHHHQQYPRPIFLLPLFPPILVSMASLDSSVDLATVDALELLLDNTAAYWHSSAHSVEVLLSSVVISGYNLRSVVFQESGGLQPVAPTAPTGPVPTHSGAEPSPPPPWTTLTPTPQTLPTAPRKSLPGSVASPMYPSSVNETLFQYSAPPSSTLDFVLDSGATNNVLRDAGTLRPLPTPTSLLADSTFSIPYHNTSTLPCPLFPSGTVTGLHIPSLRTNLLSLRSLQQANITTVFLGGANYYALHNTATGRLLSRIPFYPHSRLYTLWLPRPPHRPSRLSLYPPPPSPPSH